MKVFRRFLSINQISQDFSVFTFNNRIILLNRDSCPKDNFDCVSRFDFVPGMTSFPLEVFDIVEETDISLIYLYSLIGFFQKIKIINQGSARQANKIRKKIEQIQHCESKINEHYHPQTHFNGIYFSSTSNSHLNEIQYH